MLSEGDFDHEPHEPGILGPKVLDKIVKEIKEYYQTPSNIHITVALRLLFASTNSSKGGIKKDSFTGKLMAAKQKGIITELSGKFLGCEMHTIYWYPGPPRFKARTETSKKKPILNSGRSWAVDKYDDEW